MVNDAVPRDASEFAVRDIVNSRRAKLPVFFSQIPQTGCAGRITLHCLSPRIQHRVGPFVGVSRRIFHMPGPMVPVSPRGQMEAGERKGIRGRVFLVRETRRVSKTWGLAPLGS